MYKFPDYILENIDFLTKISKTKSETRIRKLVKEAKPEQLRAINEIIYNILKGNYPLKTRQRRKLGNNADYYRKISRARTEKGIKGRIQEGGGQITSISKILAPILSVISQHVLDKSLAKEGK